MYFTYTHLYIYRHSLTMFLCDFTKFTRKSDNSYLMSGNSTAVWDEQKLVSALMQNEWDFSCYQWVPFHAPPVALNRKVPEPSGIWPSAHPLVFAILAVQSSPPWCLDLPSESCRLSKDAHRSASNSAIQRSLWEGSTNLIWLIKVALNAPNEGILWHPSFSKPILIHLEM